MTMSRENLDESWALIQKQCENLIEVCKQQRGEKRELEKVVALRHYSPKMAFMHAQGIAAYISEIAAEAKMDIEL
jgi:hypothetical protein